MSEPKREQNGLQIKPRPLCQASKRREVLVTLPRRELGVADDPLLTSPDFNPHALKTSRLASCCQFTLQGIPDRFGTSRHKTYCFYELIRPCV